MTEAVPLLDPHNSFHRKTALQPLLCRRRRWVLRMLVDHWPIARYTRATQFTVKYGELSTYSLSSSIFLILPAFSKCMDAETRRVYQKRER
ncbi:hypothetical protein AHAS_Ahas08G0064000 [Arachis hypogaea]